MKKILFVILVLLCNNSINAQLEKHPYIGFQIKECKQKVKDIDEQVRYKTIYVLYNELPYVAYLEKRTESWYILYFDTNGTLIKVKSHDYSEAEGSSTYYFQGNVVIYTNQARTMPGEEQFASNYIDYNMNRRFRHFLATQFTLFYEEEALAVKMFTLSGIPFPIDKNNKYDIASDIESITKRIYGVDSLHMPPLDKIIPVRLVPPKAGDTTSILYHETLLYKQPSADSPVIAELNTGDLSVAFGKTHFLLGTKVNVLEVIDEKWCRVEAHELSFGQIKRSFQGYIQTQFLTPIEVKP